MKLIKALIIAGAVMTGLTLTIVLIPFLLWIGTFVLIAAVAYWIIKDLAREDRRPPW